jgi:predicted metal-dependent HD superfamily phosphohydrolase
MENMKDRWQRVWQKLGAPSVPPDVLGELLQAYSAPERCYHSLTHIRA